MEKYERVTKELPLVENELRLHKKKPIFNYFKYAQSLLTKKGFDNVVIIGVGKTIQKVFIISELVRHRVKGVHQVIEIGQETFEEVYEPLEEGLDTLVFKHTAPFVRILLTKKEPENKDSLPGYQEPLSETEVEEKAASKIKKPDRRRNYRRHRRGPRR